MEMFSLKGKTALIIGGSRGLGKSMARTLAGAGANVALVSRSQADLDAAAAEIAKATNVTAVGIGADIKSVAGVNAVVDKVLAQFGQIDILINSAGINIRKPALDFTEEDWDDVQDTQLKSVFLMCQSVAKSMVERGIKGKIINLASITSVLGFPNIVSYVAAKGAVAQLTKALATEFAPHGITVNAIGPGYFETEMTKAVFEDKERMAVLLSRTPMRRFGAEGDLAGLTLLFASSASDFITGQIVYVDGGFLAN